MSVVLTVLFIFSLYPEQGRLSTCLLQYLLYTSSQWKWLTDIRPNQVLFLFDQNVTFTLINNTKTHPCLTYLCIWWRKVTLFINDWYVFLSTLIGPLHIFKNNVGFLFVFPFGNTPVCSFSWIFFVCVCKIFTFAVEFLYPRLNLVMINSSSNKCGKMQLPKWCNPAVCLCDSCPEFCYWSNFTASAMHYKVLYWTSSFLCWW